MRLSKSELKAKGVSTVQNINHTEIKAVLLQFAKDKTPKLVLLVLVLALSSTLVFYVPIITRNITDGALQEMNAVLLVNLALFAADS